MKLQAPKGGTYSRENHEWYDGGQFMPETCLPKGVMKKVKKIASAKGNIAKIEVKGGFNGYSVYVTYAASEKAVHAHHAEKESEANDFACALLKQKSFEYEEMGLVPHPTEVLICQTTQAVTM